MSRFTSGMALGGLIAGGYSAVGADPKQRVGVPTLLGVALAILLPNEREIGAGVIVGAVGISVGVSKLQRKPALEFVPGDIRSAISEAPRHLLGR